MSDERVAPTARRYTKAQREQAVRLVRQLREETGERHGAIQRVARQLGVATIITGTYGMNFRRMPELGWVFGYPLAVAIMALTVVVLCWYFKRVGWL